MATWTCDVCGWSNVDKWEKCAKCNCPKSATQEEKLKWYQAMNLENAQRKEIEVQSKAKASAQQQAFEAAVQQQANVSVAHNGPAKTLVIVGGVLIMLGALLPWGSVNAGIFSRSISGIEGDGLITGALGTILLFIGIFTHLKSGKYFSFWGTIISIIVVVIMASKTCTIMGIMSSNSSVNTSLGIGLFVSLFGGLLGIWGGASKISALNS
jgi:cation transport ATPase